jgi:hypothetical protein
MVWRLATCVGVVAWVTAAAANWCFGQSSQYAPGVLTVIPPDPQYEETYSGPLPLVDIVKGMPQLDWDPNYAAESSTVYERAKAVTLRRTIWNLQFAFKPLRMITVDVPQPSGKMQQKRIWYLVYRIRYLGGDLQPEPVEDEFGHTSHEVRRVSHEGRFFFPQMLLRAAELNKSYQDRIIPAAKEPIQDREVKGRPLLNSVEISRKPIPLSTPEDPIDVWGVAMWEDIDPEADFLILDIQGLTNAYKPVDLPDSFKPGDEPGTGRQLLAKTLRLYFWRPGDRWEEHEGEIQYGVPVVEDPQRQAEILSKFGLKERVDYSWIYR